MIEEISKKKGQILDITSIPFNDRKTYELISTGKTSGVYLLEDKGIRKILKNISPNNFEDLIVLIALYISSFFLGSTNLEEFIRRKNREIKVRYPYHQLKDILGETYGVIVYQEQITKILQVIGGFPYNTAEILRKNLSRGEKNNVAKYKDKFIKGAIRKDIAKKDAERTFDLIQFFADLSVSKSEAKTHATYAYQTAYLKAHYPKEFKSAIIAK